MHRRLTDARGGDFIFNKQEIGRRGEEIAAAFLERKGLVIADRNFHCRWGELDLVAVERAETEMDDCCFASGGAAATAFPKQAKGTVRFVEVKTRTGTGYGTPGEAVTYAKQQKIKKTALTWLQARGEYFPCICFDVIEVWVFGRTAKIRWLQHCF